MIFRKVLSLDIETRSDVDLPKRGVYNYVNSLNFCLLWVTWAYDYGERYTLDLWHNRMPQQLIDDILDPTVLKVAANATFERICFSRALGTYLPADSWTCTLVLAGRNGLPMHLDGAAAQSRVAIQKDASGKTLIKMFSVPQKLSKKNTRLWINPADAPEQWQQYGYYNNIDVASETAVRVAIKGLPVSDFENELYVLDQKINDRGVLIDLPFVDRAIELNLVFADRLKRHIIELTGVRNPNSTKQLLEWLNQETDEDDSSFTKFDKEAVKAIIGTTDSEVIKQVCEARLTLNKASVAKYAAMRRYAGADGRARGTLQFYGANRTGRWAGRGIQLHNLTKHKVSPEVLNSWRELIKSGNLEGLAQANKGNLNDALSQAVRTSFIAKPGHHFIVSDYSAIEARVLAWVAGEQWRLDFFNGTGDIYIESIARMLNMDPATIDKKNPLRQNGKVAELACGYSGGVNALKQMMKSLGVELPENQLPEIIRLWRLANPAIANFWKLVDEAARRAIVSPGNFVGVGASPKIYFIYRNENLHMCLPSGRWLTYVRAKINMNRFGNPGITYEGTGDQGKWMVLDTYGGKLTENICQAIARDILAHGLINIDKAGFNIVLHVHDEAVIEEPINGRSLEEVNHLMCVKAPWYADMPLKAEGFVSPYYKKDDA